MILINFQISLESQAALDILHRLFESVAPSVFRPVDILLKTLLAPPVSVVSAFSSLINLTACALACMFVYIYSWIQILK